MLQQLTNLLTCDYAMALYLFIEVVMVGYAVSRFLRWDAQRNKAGE